MLQGRPREQRGPNGEKGHHGGERAPTWPQRPVTATCGTCAQGCPCWSADTDIICWEHGYRRVHHYDDEACDFYARRNVRGVAAAPQLPGGE